MQKSFECPLCIDFYSATVRVPKTLSCGHGFCAPCLQTMVKSSDFVRCPNCRVTCDVPGSEVDKLPTNFPLLSLLGAMCEQCFASPHTQRCSHCPKSLCATCLSVHGEAAGKEVDRELGVLGEYVQRLSGTLQRDEELKDATGKAKAIMDNMRKDFEEKVRALRQEHEDKVGIVKAQLTVFTDDVLLWKEALQKAISEATKIQESDNEPLTKDQVRKVIDKLREAEVSKPSRADFQLPNEPVQPEPEPVPSAPAENFIVASAPPPPEDFLEPPPKYESLDVKPPLPSPKRPNYSTASSVSVFKYRMGGGPAAVCCDPVTGNIIATDCEQSRIYILSASLKFQRMFGCRGHRFGQYNYPFGVVSDGESLFIADSKNHRICVCDMSGNVQRMFGSEGREKGELRTPTSLALDSRGRLYICDEDNRRVTVMNKRGAYIADFGSQEFANFYDNVPKFIAISADDMVAVTGSRGAIFFFKATGESLRTERWRINPTGIVFDHQGNLLIADSAAGRVVVVKMSGQSIGSIGGRGSQPDDKLNSPNNVTITKGGDVIVCDIGNKVIQLYQIPQR